jgi:hypothetical protein
MIQVRTFSDRKPASEWLGLPPRFWSRPPREQSDRSPCPGCRARAAQRRDVGRSSLHPRAWSMAFSFGGDFLPGRFYAAKTEMICAGIDFAFAARADDVARAILVVAKKRATAMDALLLVRLGWIEW